MTALVDMLDEGGMGSYMRNASADKKNGSQSEATDVNAEKQETAFIKKQLADVNHGNEAGAGMTRQMCKIKQEKQPPGEAPYTQCKR